MLHDPRTEDFQGPIVLPFGLPIYNNSTCWISLRNVIVELLGQAICRFIIVLYPFLRTRDLFVFNGGNGRAHGGERELEQVETNGPIEGGWLSMVSDRLRRGLS